MPQLLYLAYKTPIQADKNQLYRETLGYVKKRYGIEDHQYARIRALTSVNLAEKINRHRGYMLPVLLEITHGRLYAPLEFWKLYRSIYKAVKSLKYMLRRSLQYRGLDPEERDFAKTVEKALKITAKTNRPLRVTVELHGREYTVEVAPLSIEKYPGAALLLMYYSYVPRSKDELLGVSSILTRGEKSAGKTLYILRRHGLLRMRDGKYEAVSQDVVLRAYRGIAGKIGFLERKAELVKALYALGSRDAPCSAGDIDAIMYFPMRALYVKTSLARVFEKYAKLSEKLMIGDPGILYEAAGLVPRVMSIYGILVNLDSIRTKIINALRTIVMIGEEKPAPKSYTPWRRVAECLAGCMDARFEEIYVEAKKKLDEIFGLP